MTADLLPGLRRALALCELIDAQCADGFLREPVECVEAVREEIRRIEFQEMIHEKVERLQ